MTTTRTFTKNRTWMVLGSEHRFSVLRALVRTQIALSPAVLFSPSPGALLLLHGSCEERV